MREYHKANVRGTGNQVGTLRSCSEGNREKFPQAMLISKRETPQIPPSCFADERESWASFPLLTAAAIRPFD